jgi:effector-binding domain-containing protein
MAYQCEVREQSAQPALSIRTRTSVQNLPGVIGKAYGAIAQYVGGLGEAPSGPPFAAYYNMDMNDLDVEMGFPVGRPLAGHGDIVASQMPGGKVATCLHTGPYSELHPAYQALSEWIQARGYEPTGVTYELYLNDPGHTPPQDLQTLIMFPLKGA